MNKEIKKEEMVEEVEETKQPEKVVETTAEVVETKTKIPAKIKVGNFVRKHRVAIVSTLTGLAGAGVGLIFGIKIGENKAGDMAALPDVTDTEIPEIPEIPNNVN